MKRFIVIVSASLLALPLFGQDKSPQLKDQKEKVSYSIGVQIGKGFGRQKVDVNPDKVAAGIKDTLAGKSSPDQVSYSMGVQIGTNLGRQKVDVNPDKVAAGIKDALTDKLQLTEDQIREVLTQFDKDMQQKLGEKNRTEGAKFLEENKKKPGVKTTPSGLQYKVEKEGTGAQPKATDAVTVNYRGTLIDGTEFDSSYKRKQATTFALSGDIIKGWTEALQLMKVGSKYQLFIPSDLAYGEHVPPGADMLANATLIFDVELLDTKPAPTPAPAAAVAPKAPTSPASPKK